MRFLIAGAGAIGGYIGAKLAKNGPQSGDDVTLYARGPHLAAMQRDGLQVVGAEESFGVHPRIVGDLAELDRGECDVIFLGVKAHGLTALAPQVARLIDDNVTVVSTQNGVPWWMIDGLERVDPGGAIAKAIPKERVVGSIAYFATEIAEPGVIKHIEGNRISLGEPDGSRSDRVRAIAERLIKAGLKAPVTARLGHEIWVKILGNVAFNPLSALTRATLEQMVRDEGTRELVRNIMTEAEGVAAKLGMELPVTIEQRIAGAEKVGAHKTSMLQDLEAGRPMEIEAIVGAVVELGDRLAVAMPHTRSVYAAAKLLDKVSRGELK